MVPDFLADLFAVQDAGLAQHLQVVRDGGARQRRGGDDLADGEPLAGLEHEEDALAVRVAQRDEHPRGAPPGAGNGAGVARSHSVASVVHHDYMTSYVVRILGVARALVK